MTGRSLASRAQTSCSAFTKKSADRSRAPSARSFASGIFDHSLKRTRLSSRLSLGFVHSCPTRSGSSGSAALFSQRYGNVKLTWLTVKEMTVFGAWTFQGAVPEIGFPPAIRASLLSVREISQAVARPPQTPDRSRTCCAAHDTTRFRGRQEICRYVRWATQLRGRS